MEGLMSSMWDSRECKDDKRDTDKKAVAQQKVKKELVGR